MVFRVKMYTSRVYRMLMSYTHIALQQISIAPNKKTPYQFITRTNDSRRFS